MRPGETMTRFGYASIALVLVALLSLCAFQAFAADAKAPAGQPTKAATLQLSPEKQVEFLKLQNLQAQRTIRMQALEKEYLQLQSDQRVVDSQIESFLRSEAKTLEIDYDKHQFRTDSLMFELKPEPEKPAPDKSAKATPDPVNTAKAVKPPQRK
jgi:hypothetical protein